MERNKPQNIQGLDSLLKSFASIFKTFQIKSTHDYLLKGIPTFEVSAGLTDASKTISELNLGSQKIPVKVLNIAEALGNKLANPIHSRFTSLDQLRQVSKVFETGAYFHAANPLDIGSAAIFAVAKLFNAANFATAELAPIISDIIQKTDNTFLQTLLTTLFHGLLRAHEAQKVSTTEKYLRKITDVITKTYSVLTDLFTFLKSKFDEVMSHFINDMDSFWAALISGGSFLTPFVKLLIGPLKETVAITTKIALESLKSILGKPFERLLLKFISPKENPQVKKLTEIQNTLVNILEATEQVASFLEAGLGVSVPGAETLSKVKEKLTSPVINPETYIQRKVQETATKATSKVTSLLSKPIEAGFTGISGKILGLTLAGVGAAFGLSALKKHFESEKVERTIKPEEEIRAFIARHPILERSINIINKFTSTIDEGLRSLKASLLNFFEKQREIYKELPSYKAIEESLEKRVAQVETQLDKSIKTIQFTTYSTVEKITLLGEVLASSITKSQEEFKQYKQSLVEILKDTEKSFFTRILSTTLSIASHLNEFQARITKRLESVFIKADELYRKVESSFVGRLVKTTISELESVLKPATTYIQETYDKTLALLIKIQAEKIQEVTNQTVKSIVSSYNRVAAYGEYFFTKLDKFIDTKVLPFLKDTLIFLTLGVKYLKVAYPDLKRSTIEFIHKLSRTTISAYTTLKSRLAKIYKDFNIVKATFFNKYLPKIAAEFKSTTISLHKNFVELNTEYLKHTVASLTRFYHGLSSTWYSLQKKLTNNVKTLLSQFTKQNIQHTKTLQKTTQVFMQHTSTLWKKISSLTGKFYKDSDLQFKQLIRAIQENLKTLGNHVVAYIKTLLSKTESLFKRVSEKVEQTFSFVKKFITGLFKRVSGSVPSIIKTVSSFFKSQSVDCKAVYKDTFSQVRSYIEKVSSMQTKTTKNLFETFAHKIHLATDKLDKYTKSTVNVITRIIQHFATNLTRTKESIPGFIQEKLRTLEILKRKLSLYETTRKNTVSEKTTQLLSSLNKKIDKLVAIESRVVKNLKSVLSKLISSGFSLFKKAKGLSLTDIFTGIGLYHGAKTILGKTRALIGAGVNLGKNAVTSIAEGITAKTATSNVSKTIGSRVVSIFSGIGKTATEFGARVLSSEFVHTVATGAANILTKATPATAAISALALLGYLGYKKYKELKENEKSKFYTEKKNESNVSKSSTKTEEERSIHSKKENEISNVHFKNIAHEAETHTLHKHLSHITNETLRTLGYNTLPVPAKSEKESSIVNTEFSEKLATLSKTINQHVNTTSAVVKSENVVVVTESKKASKLNTLLENTTRPISNIEEYWMLQNIPETVSMSTRNISAEKLKEMYTDSSKISKYFKELKDYITNFFKQSTSKNAPVVAPVMNNVSNATNTIINNTTIKGGLDTYYPDSTYTGF